MANAKTERSHIHLAENRYRETRRATAAADGTAYWFAAAAVFAFLTAGIIVYRVAASDLRLPSGEARPMSVAAASSPVEQPPIYVHV
jgi:hypothetical protein